MKTQQQIPPVTKWKRGFAQKGKPLLERFWEKVVKGTGCWHWIGYRNKQGYGQIKLPHRAVLCHRFSFDLHHGSFDESKCVLHRCDIPSCVRPDHLFLGTRRDNSADAVAKGRFPKGSEHWFAKLTEKDIGVIKRAVANGASRTAIAKVFGVSRRTIGLIMSGKRWGHVKYVPAKTGRHESKSKSKSFISYGVPHRVFK